MPRLKMKMRNGTGRASAAYELHKWLIRSLKFLVLDCTYLVSDIRAEFSSTASCKKSIEIAAVVLWVRVSTRTEVVRVLFAEMV